MTSEEAPPSEKAQRLRVRFARGPEASEIGHLDQARCWERALRDGGVAVSYSQGNRPQPRLTLAAGLAQGATSDGELLDVVLAERVAPGEVASRAGPHLPPGLDVVEVWEVGLSAPSLPTLVRWADYDVDVVPGDSDVRGAVDAFMTRETLDWEDTRGEKTRRYDLRALVQDVRVESCGEGARLRMRLRTDASRAGRPDQVVKALGLPQASRVHRVALLLSETSPAHDAWRRRGRYLT